MFLLQAHEAMEKMEGLADKVLGGEDVGGSCHMLCCLTH